MVIASDVPTFWNGSGNTQNRRNYLLENEMPAIWAVLVIGIPGAGTLRLYLIG